jgi:hypothetical protein
MWMSASMSHERSNSSASAELNGSLLTRLSWFLALGVCFKSMKHVAMASSAGTLSWSAARGFRV